MQRLKIFIGSSEINKAEQQVLVHTLQKKTTKPLDLYIIDCTNFKVFQTNGKSFKEWKCFNNYSKEIKFATNFSLSRFLIPYWCEYRGHALYLDSDIICHTDISKIEKYVNYSCAFNCVSTKEAESAFFYRYNLLKLEQIKNPDTFLTSVLFLNNEKLNNFDFEKVLEDLKNKKTSYHDLMFLTSSFREQYLLSVGKLPSSWNHLDLSNQYSLLTHYTDLTSQPWRSNLNFISLEWDELMKEAVSEGFLTIKELKILKEKKFINRTTFYVAKFRNRLTSRFLRISTLFFNSPFKFLLCLKALLKYQTKRISQ